MLRAMEKQIVLRGYFFCLNVVCVEIFISLVNIKHTHNEKQTD